jgi:predicted transcriptional regulator of viral defense system
MFYVIVPLEYKNAGGPPPSWYIDDLMKFQKQPYYVGLLSAAALHGIAHQQPQEFQIITNKPIRPIVISRYSIRFFTKRLLQRASTSPITTFTGYMQVSTPETTAFDLLRYVNGVGGLNQIATVLTELQEKINPKALLKAAQAEPELAYIQRAGFLLDHCGAKEQTKLLAEWIDQQKRQKVLLDPAKELISKKKNDKWHVYINEQIEADFLT